MASAPAPSPAGEPAADRQGPADPLDTATPSEYDAPAPGPDAKPLKLKDKPLAEVIRGLVLAATVLIHQSLARTPEELEAGVWLAGEDEASGISDPLAKVANRHAGGLAVNPDTGDLIAAGVAAAGYLVSNAMRAFQIRRAVAKHRRAGIPAQPTEGAAE